MAAPSGGAGGDHSPAENAPGIPHRDFLESALSSAAEWTRFADPKALGVLVLLGLGLTDLLDHADRLIYPHDSPGSRCIVIRHHSCGGIGATCFFVLAALLAGLVVVTVTKALFSQLTMKGLLGEERDLTLPKSRYYFEQVRRYGSQEAYSQAVIAQTEYALLRDIAGQVWEVSRISHSKHLWTRRAYVCVLAFLFCWACARVLLTTV
jgi:hypothetical protein